MGPNTLNESQLADWYGLSHPETVNGVPIGQVITQYLTDGQAEGVRGDIAFVQATHETGFFTSPDTALDNFAGIGHPSGAVSGIPFGGVGAGVLAHIQLLKEAVEGNNAAMVLPKAAPPWGGAQVTTWSQLTGTWATDPLYDVGHGVVVPGDVLGSGRYGERLGSQGVGEVLAELEVEESFRVGLGLGKDPREAW